MPKMLSIFVKRARKGYLRTARMPGQQEAYSQSEPVPQRIIQISPVFPQSVEPMRFQPIVEPIKVPIQLEGQVPRSSQSAQAVQTTQSLQSLQEQKQVAVPSTVRIPSAAPQNDEHVEVNIETHEDSERLLPMQSGLIMRGIKIPDFSIRNVPSGNAETAQKKQYEHLSYPLIPSKPAKGEKVYARAEIFWDQKLNRYTYQVIEPEMTANIKNAMIKVKDLLEQKLDVSFSQMRTSEAREYIHQQVELILSYYGMNLSQVERDTLHYYMNRNFIGFGRVEPLMQDSQIEDISCDGIDIPIFVFHRNPVIGSLMTNIVYRDAGELDSFVVRLAQIAGKSVSVATPLVNGSLPDGSRIQATLATDIARRGSNFTVRKFTEKPLTPIHLINYGTVDVKTLAYLWLAVDFGKSVIVSGGTASGKTTMLNVISLFIRPEKKIVSIEDTPELKLPHPHWVPQVARSTVEIEEGRKFGEVDLFDLLKESLRQRPDYIIVGEVRGKEAYVLFQEMATGHPSLSTIHAENMPKLLDRLISPPISLPPSLVSSANIIVFLVGTRYRDRQVRRVNEILEITGTDEITKEPRTNQVFKWNPINDTFVISNPSMIMREIAAEAGMSEKQITDELERRMLLLNWMRAKNLTEYTDVNAVVNLYYNFPDRVISSITGAKS